MDKPTKTRRRARASLAAAVVLAVLLVLTTVALGASFVRVDDNLFEAGRVEIARNGGKPVFTGGDLNIEPGHTLVRDFTVENLGTAEAYVRLYLQDVEGTLGQVLTFSVYDGEELLYTGSADAFTRDNPCVMERPLAAGETRTLTAVVHMREDAGNRYQTGGIAFTIAADAVQVRNNPERDFG